MVTSFTDWLITSLHSWNFLGVAGLLILVAFAAILLSMRFFGRSGLYGFMIVAVVASNVQVLKAVETGFTKYPLTLGTMLFACTYLVTDILTEYYDRKYARRAILLGFVAYFLFNLIMILTLGFKPLEVSAELTGWQWAQDNHHHMYYLFSPAPRFFIASTISYLMGQYLNVWIYTLIRKILPKNRWLWLRNTGSTFLAALVDDIVFSVLAWYLLIDTPMAWDVIIYTYILGCFGIRMAMTLLGVPVIYLARYFKPTGPEKSIYFRKTIRDGWIRVTKCKRTIKAKSVS